MDETRFYKLLADVLHGDVEHKEWLTESFNAAWNNQPVPLPRGSGTKDRLYVELLASQKTVALLAKDNEELKELLKTKGI